MRRLLVAIALLSMITTACGKDKKDVAAATTTTSSTVLATTTTTPHKPTTTAKKGVAATTTTQKDTRIPADSQTPAAGACADAVGGYGDITLNPDIPSPRCVIVHDTDFLRVKNNMGVAVFVDDGAGGFTIENGATYTAMKALGGYWQPGVHRLKVSNKATHVALYGGSGPEVWLK